MNTKITLLDGGMGQELLRRSSRPITRLWSADIMLNEPHLVRDLHKDFILSGARIITLNTYTATPERLKRENEMANFHKLHVSAIQAAKTAIDLAEHSGAREGTKIAACLPPLVASYRPEVSLSFEQALPSYERLVEEQASDSDIFICETMASIAEASAACSANDYALEWIKNGASIVGGCCEISPLHIQTLRERLINEGFELT